MAEEEFSDDGSIDSQLEWELDEGIPQFEDPPIEKYMAGRNALIEQEKKQRHDRLFKQTMSPIAREAAKIVESIRRREIHEKWTSDLEQTLTAQTDTTLYPGMMYNLARDRMESTELWKIVRRMPKGALLHAHIDGMFDSEPMIDQAIDEPGYCILASEGLNDEKRRSNLMFQFKYFAPADIEKAAGSTSIWADGYIPNTPITVKEAADTFPKGKTAFKSWLISRCTITKEESLDHHLGLNAVWAKFQTTFRIIGSLANYEPIFRKAMQRLLAQLADDGISYVDFRLAFVFDFYLKEQTKPQSGYSDYFRIFDEEIENFKKTEGGKTFRGARMIWTVIRKFGNQVIAESMKECIRIKKLYPHLICGFDCVGQEDLGRTLADLTPMLFWFKRICFEAGLDIPFFFHAGECLGDGNDTDNNLFDAVLLGTRRIGHGYSLYKHPLLIDMVKEKKILVESCVISNEILRLTSSVLAHSLPALLSRGVAVSLNNDDPSILGTGTNGLTHDFWQALMGSDNLGLEGLGTMAENSLRWCAIEDQKPSEWIQGITESYLGKTVKAKLLKEWRSDFEKWCQWIILEYPLELDEDEEEEEGYGEEDADDEYDE